MLPEYENAGIYETRAPARGPGTGERRRSGFPFGTDGLHSAVEQAHAAAGDKKFNVMGAEIPQQVIHAGLLGGKRLLEHLGAEPIELGRTHIVEAMEDVTHPRVRIRR